MSDPLLLDGLDNTTIEDAIADKRTKKANPTTQKNAETAAKREERLAAAATAKSGPSAPPPSPMPEVDKSALLDKITNYKERFTHLKSRNKITAKSTVDEIMDELHYLESQLGQRDGNLPEQAFLLALSALEEGHKLYNPFHLDLHGLSAVARENKAQFTPIIDELVIKYGINMTMGPEMRLALSLGTLVYTVHAANTGNARVAQALQKMSQKMPTPATDL